MHATIPPCHPPPPHPPPCRSTPRHPGAGRALDVPPVLQHQPGHVPGRPRRGRIVWVNEGYKRFLPALGFSSRGPVRRPPGRGRGAQHADAPRAGDRPADPDRPAHQPGRHLRRQPHSAARRQQRRGDRRDRHRAVRPSRDHAAAADQQVRAACSATWTTRAANSPAQRRTQVHPGQLRRQQPGGGGSQAPGAARGAVVQPGAAAGRNRHRQGTAGACDPCGVGARARGPFVSVNIAAVPDTLLEAEFFGVAPGAFTGADRKGRDGKFKLADGGTLFLDEIGDMPLGLQPKLLRALQEGEIEPLGSNKVVPVRCARDRRHLARPRGAGARGQVPRRPLLPPQRAADPRAAAARAARRHPGAGRGAGARTWRCAAARRRPSSAPTRSPCSSAQHWRGNIRELRNVLEQAAMRSDSQHIDARAARGSAARGRASSRSLPPEPLPPARRRPAAGAAPLRPLAEQVAELERRRDRRPRWRPPAATSWRPRGCSASRAPRSMSVCEIAD